MIDKRFGQYAADIQNDAEIYFQNSATAKQQAGWELCCRQFLAEHKTDNFSRNLFHMITEKGLDPVEVYKKARIDRRLFSKIRSNPEYAPGKKTVCALALGMKLDIVETRSLLADSGYCLSPKLLFDVLLTFFIQRRIYDIDIINGALLQYEQTVF